MSEERTTSVTVKMTPEQYRWLRVASAMRNVSMAEYVRQWAEKERKKAL